MRATRSVRSMGGTYNRLYDPGINLAGTTVFAVSMLDNAGGVISIPSLVGSSDLWFRDTGTAFRNQSKVRPKGSQLTCCLDNRFLAACSYLRVYASLRGPQSALRHG